MKIEATAYEVAELISFLHGRVAPGVGRHVADPIDQEFERLLNTEVGSADDAVLMDLPTGPLDLDQQVKNVVYGEMKHVLSDIEFRVKQAYDVDHRTEGSGQVYAEDLNLAKHTLTGYTVTANTPSAGSIAWASLHVVYNGTDYAITDGNTANKYVWFDPAATQGTTTLQMSDTKPDLTTKPDAALLFVNNGGTPVDVVKSTIPVAVADNAIDAGAILAGAVTSNAIASNAVTSSAIAAGAVGSTEIASNAVGSTQLASGAVTSGKIGASAVGSTNIASGAVGSTALASGAVTSTAIAGGAVGSTQLATGAVTNGKIGASAVDSTALASGAVTAGKIGTSAVTSTNLASGAVTSSAIASGAVGTSQIASGAVGNTQLGANAVDSSKIASGAVGSTQLASGAVTASAIATGAVGSASLGPGAVTAAKLNTLQHLLY